MIEGELVGFRGGKTRPWYIELHIYDNRLRIFGHAKILVNFILIHILSFSSPLSSYDTIFQIFSTHDRLSLTFNCGESLI